MDNRTQLLWWGQVSSPVIIRLIEITQICSQLNKKYPFAFFVFYDQQFQHRTTRHLDTSRIFNSWIILPMDVLLQSGNCKRNKISVIVILSSSQQIVDLLNVVLRTVQHIIYIAILSSSNFFSTYGLFIYSYTVHCTHDTTAREFLLQSFVAQLKTNYPTHFGHTVLCQERLHVYWLITCVLLNSLTCNFDSVCSISKIKYPYALASFRSLVLEHGGREPYFWDVLRIFKVVLKISWNHY